MSNIDLEASVNDAANASTALALALRGIDKLAIEQEDEQMAIQWLANAARFAPQKCLVLRTKRDKRDNLSRSTAMTTIEHRDLMIIEHLDRPPAGWFALDVMRAREGRKQDWCADG